MKIQLPLFAHTSKINKLQNQTSYSRKINFTNKEDSFTKTNEEIQTSIEFENLIADDFLKQNIIKDIFIDKNGTYHPELEQEFIKNYMYLAFVAQRENILKNNTIIQDDNLAQATYGVFNLLKNKDGSFNFENNNIKELLEFYYEVQQEGLVEPYQLLKHSIASDGEVVKPIAESAYLMMKEYGEDLDMKTAFFLVSRYCVNKETMQLYIDKAAILGQIFSVSRCQIPQGSDYLVSIITDGKDDVDFDRYAFTFNAFIKIYKQTLKEISAEDAYNSTQIISVMGANIIDKIIFNNRDENNNVNYEKLGSIFDDWFEYAINNKSYIENTTKLDIVDEKTKEKSEVTIAKTKEISNDAKLPIFNTSIFRLYHLFKDVEASKLESISSKLN